MRRLAGSLLVAVAALICAAPALLAADGGVDRAWAALQRGDAEGAVLLVSEVIGGGKLSPEEAGAAYNMRGMAMMKLEDFSGGEADFTVAIELVPEFAAALANRGLARAKLERYAEAVTDFDRALDIVPGEPELLFMRGNARFDGGDLLRAVEDYTGAIRAAPDHWMALMNRCDALGKLGRVADAKLDCAKAKQLAPDPTVVSGIEQSLGQPCDCKPR